MVNPPLYEAWALASSRTHRGPACSALEVQRMGAKRDRPWSDSGPTEACREAFASEATMSGITLTGETGRGAASVCRADQCANSTSGSTRLQTCSECMRMRRRLTTAQGQYSPSVSTRRKAFLAYT
jgi:hypothetical protein